MLQQLINLSPDLKRLQDEGYEVAVRGGYLVIHHIPYVNHNKQVQYGTMVSTLTLAGDKTSRPDNHVIHFTGEHPCNKDGSIITAIQHASNKQQLYDGITIHHSFSNKPAEGYKDYYDKVVRYADIITGPAKSIDKDATEKTFVVANEEGIESLFQYQDTNSTRAHIAMINAKFNSQRVAIIGLGGTGAYVLDLIAKTPVAEIHLFDGDIFLQHNAFRSPGAVTKDQIGMMVKKVTYFQTVYSHMHRHIIPHDFYVGEHNIAGLDAFDYVFICIDRNSARKTLMDYLLRKNMSFIDVGLGVQIVNNALTGAVRVTSATPLKNDHLIDRVAIEDREDEAYTSNIQIADLNMLNASLAVIKWKKFSGFYIDLIEEHNCTYTINTSQLDATDYQT